MRPKCKKKKHPRIGKCSRKCRNNGLGISRTAPIPKQAPADAGQDPRTADPEEECFQGPATKKWWKESVTWRNSLGVSPKYSPWTSRAEFRGAGMRLNDRKKDLLDVVVADRMYRSKKLHQGLDSKQIAELMKDVWLDVSQSHSRKVTSTAPRRTLTTSSEVYAFGRDRVLLPTEHLALQGHFAPTLKLPLTARQVRSLAGEGMALPSIGSVLWCLFLTKRFPEPEA